MKSESRNALEIRPPAVSQPSRLLATLTHAFRTQLANYLQVFAGTGVRLGLQAVYFFILANTLSLHDIVAEYLAAHSHSL